MPQASVLLVDDDRLILDLYAAAIRRRGFLVHQATDAITARAIVTSTRPELACVDGRLVRDSGPEIAAELAAAGVRVVLLTNDQRLYDRPPRGTVARFIKANTPPLQLAFELERLLERAPSTPPPPL